MVKTATSPPFALPGYGLQGKVRSFCLHLSLSFLPSNCTHVLSASKAPVVVVVYLSDIYIYTPCRRHLTNSIYLSSTTYPVSTARRNLFSDFTLADGSYTAYKNTPISSILTPHLLHLLEPLTQPSTKTVSTSSATVSRDPRLTGTDYLWASFNRGSTYSSSYRGTVIR